MGRDSIGDQSARTVQLTALRSEARSAVLLWEGSACEVGVTGDHSNGSHIPQPWLLRLRAELAAIESKELALYYRMQLAKLELDCGLTEDARSTLSECLARFGLLVPGAWTPQVQIAAGLCARLSENALLVPEVARGAGWLAQPEVATYDNLIRECVHDIAIQAGRADIAADTVSAAWPGKEANLLIAQCRLAGWKPDAAEVQRLLPRIRQAIAAAGPSPQHVGRMIGYWLARACVHTGHFAEAIDVCQDAGIPGAAWEELVIASRAAGQEAIYARARDGWLNGRLEQFRGETSNHHWASSAVRYCALTIRRMGDDDGYRTAIGQFREAAAASSPVHDSFACAVMCDLAVLFGIAGETAISAEYLATAQRLYDGKEPNVRTERGSRSLMASILSPAHRDLGSIDLAVRFAKKITSAGERRLHLVSALIHGGRAADAEAELGKLDAPADRAGLILSSLSVK